MISPARLQAYLRDKLEQREVVVVPPFTALFHPTDSHPEASYAVPDMPDLPADGVLAAALARLRAAFAMRGRAPHIQFLDSFAPAFAPALQGAGFVETQRLLVMVCALTTARPAPMVPGLSVVMLSDRSPLDAVREGLDVNALGFDPQAIWATEAEAEAFRRTLITSRAFIARLNGQPVGAGMFTEIYDEITELAGITTLGPFRRRGIATYLTAHMAQLAFQHGAKTAFLIAADAGAARVYESVGFRPYTSLLSFSDGFST